MMAFSEVWFVCYFLNDVIWPYLWSNIRMHVPWALLEGAGRVDDPFLQANLSQAFVNIWSAKLTVEVR